jgi:ferredoxin
MGVPQRTLHYVATYREAAELIRAHDRLWLARCGCRASRRPGERCSRSREEVCVWFRPDVPMMSKVRPMSWPEAEHLLEEAREALLVPRPFRDDATRTETDGVCFCCDDCCSYFLDPDEPCDAGAMIATLDREACTACGDCVEVCRFGARTLFAERLVVADASCAGCGLCVDVCSAGCVAMVARR